MDSKQMGEKNVSSSSTGCVSTASGVDMSDPQNINRFVQNLLNTFEEKMETMTKVFLDQLDEVNSRVDDIERNLTACMKNAGMDVEGSGQDASGHCQSTSKE